MTLLTPRPSGPATPPPTPAPPPPPGPTGAAHSPPADPGITPDPLVAAVTLAGLSAAERMALVEEALSPESPW